MKEYKLGSLFDGSGGFCLAGLLNGLKPVWSSEIEPYCLKVTEKRFPDVKQLGNIMDIDGGKIEPVDVITFGSPCILKGSMVHTDSGYKPIEDVTVLDKVLTHTGEYKQVLESRYTGHKPIWELHTMCGRLHATEDHRIYVRKKTGKNKYSDPDFIPVKDLDKEKYFVGVPVDGIEENPMNLTAEECWLIGRYVADGYIRNEQRPNRPEGSLYNVVVFCVGTKKQREFEENAQKYVFSKSAVSRSCSKYSIRNTRLLQLCEDCGCGAENKTFPHWVLDLPVSLLKQVLNGYLSGDGTQIKNVTKSATVSRKLALAVGYAVAKVYHRPFSIYKIIVDKTKLIEGRTVNQRDWYQVVWRREPTKKFAAFYDDGYIWCPVNAVYPLHYKDAVYDLTVEGDHSFCVENIAVHNCQDLSVAGKQLGIHEGKRSNLFFEAVRVIKEMRDATANKFPRFAVWENVPGAFSSNGGKDFKAVLEALCGICGGGVTVPEPPKGKWKPTGCCVGDGFSVAWRVYDAQYWGVPQRRKRIYLIADFGSERAGEILFESESMRGDSETGGKAGEDPSADAHGGTRGSNPSESLKNAAGCSFSSEAAEACKVYCLQGNGIDRADTAGCNGCGWRENASYTLNTIDRPAVCYAMDSISSNSMKSGNPYSGFHEENVTKTLDTKCDPTCNHGGNVIVERVMACSSREMSMMVTENVANTLVATDYKGAQVLCYEEKNCTGAPDVLVLNDQGGQMMDVSDKAGCLRAQEHGHQPVVCFEPGIMQRDCKTGSHISVDVSPTIRANSGDNRPAVCFQQNQRNEVRTMGDKAGALTANCGMKNQNYVCLGIENHATDSRVTLQKPGDPVQTLTERMGTGGCNVPMVLIYKDAEDADE